MHGQRGKVPEQEKSGGIKSYERLSAFLFFLFFSVRDVGGRGVGRIQWAEIQT